ncbi:MAG: hypothetical protein ACXVXP_12145 [Mycobacteriaceae bacterium]
MSRRRRHGHGKLLVAGAVLASGVLTACSGTAADHGPVPTSAAPTPGAVTVAVPDVVVTVTNPGAEPRTTLARHATPDATQQVSLTANSAITQTVGTNASTDQSSPDVTLPIAASQHGASDAPTHSVGLVVDVPSSPDSTLAAALLKAKGSRATLVAGPDGAVKQLVLDPPADLSDAGRSAVEQALRQAVQFAPVLPSVPVGVGAVWTVSQQINSLGLGVRQDTVLTLAAVRGSTVTLAVQVTQTPLTPAWTLPNDQGTLNVDSYALAGTGNLTVDLTKPLPLDGQVQLTGDQLYSRPKDGLKITQKVSNGVSWKS